VARVRILTIIALALVAVVTTPLVWSWAQDDPPLDPTSMESIKRAEGRLADER
jgi:hypothetical protein